MANVRDPFERQHIANLAAYVRMIDEIFRQATQEAASIGAMVQNIGFDESDLFSFEKYPYTKARIDRLMSGLAGGVQTTIVNGINAEWTLANNKNSELARRVFGDSIGRLTQAQYRRYFSTNDAAREAFLARKEQGLNLSERVWNYANGFKSDMELGLDVGIRNGVPADEMSRELRQYLRHPDKLFRRVRDEHGDLVLSKRAQDFHPGQGVYRSSYMNARRLTATETNIAYRTADYERAQQLDFIVGIEVKLSNNHNCKGVPAGMFYDICDELQGRYPKNFKFTGWHSQCRCHVETILKTEEELMAENRAILNGEEPSQESVNRVADVPQNFKEWLEENKERAAKHYSMPYFIKDNRKYIPAAIASNYGSKLPYDTLAEYTAAMMYNKKHAGFSADIRKNINELNDTLPVVQGKVMNFTEADGRKPNPKFNPWEDGYSQNCGTCAPAYLLRRRGFDVEAGEYTKGVGIVSKIHDDVLRVWKHADGTLFKPTDPEIVTYSRWAGGRSSSQSVSLRSFLHDNADSEGIYMVYLKWRENDTAHVTILERDKGGNFIYYDPQSGKKNWLSGWETKVDLSRCWMMRIDDKLINEDCAGAFVKAR